MEYVYKTYCISRMLLDKGSGYVLNNELREFKKTQRVYGDNKGIVGSIYDLTYDASLIIDNIYLGNAYNARDYYKLKEHNIGLIINCTKDIPNYFEGEEDIEYERVDVQDVNGAIILPYIKKVVPLLKSMRKI